MVEAYVYEGAEVGNVADRAFHDGAFLDFGNVGNRGAGQGLGQVGSGVAAGADQGVQDVVDCRKSGGEFFRHFFFIHPGPLFTEAGDFLFIL